jgi:hypothetical protein
VLMDFLIFLDNVTNANLTNILIKVYVLVVQTVKYLQIKYNVIVITVFIKLEESVNNANQIKFIVILPKYALVHQDFIQ